MRSLGLQVTAFTVKVKKLLGTRTGKHRRSSAVFFSPSSVVHIRSNMWQAVIDLVGMKNSFFLYLPYSASFFISNLYNIAISYSLCTDIVVPVN